MTTRPLLAACLASARPLDGPPRRGDGRRLCPPAVRTRRSRRAVDAPREHRRHRPGRRRDLQREPGPGRQVARRPGRRRRTSRSSTASSARRPASAASRSQTRSATSSSTASRSATPADSGDTRVAAVREGDGPGARRTRFTNLTIEGSATRELRQGPLLVQQLTTTWSSPTASITRTGGNPIVIEQHSRVGTTSPATRDRAGCRPRSGVVRDPS